MVSIVLLVLAAGIPYLFTLNSEFVLDDNPLIAGDSSVHSFSGITQAFSRGFISGAGMPNSYYRPLVTVSYVLNYALFEAHPWGYKLANVLLHILVTVLVFLLARRVIPKGIAPLSAALLFAVHPAHAEAVSWISARTDLLQSVFSLGALLAFWRYLEADRSRMFRCLGWYVASIAFFALAMFSKESALVVPLIIIVLPFYAGKKSSFKFVLGQTIPFVAVVLLYLAAKQSVLGYAFSQNAVFTGLWGRLLVVPAFVLAYLRMLFIPGLAQPLHIPHTAPIISVFGWIGLLALVGIPIALWRKSRAIAFAAGWVSIGLLLVLNIVPILGLRPCERFVYFPSIGLALIVGLAVNRLHQWKPFPISVVFGAIAFVLAVQSYAGSVVWRNETSVVARMVEGNPKFHNVRILAGTVYEEHGQPTRAIAEYAAAVALKPNDLQTRLRLIRFYQRTGDNRAMLKEVQAIARQLPNEPTVIFSLARAYVANADYQEAADAFHRGLQLDKTNDKARYELALVLIELNRNHEARVELDTIIQNGGEMADHARQTILDYQL